jgi:hypothetical protein
VPDAAISKPSSLINTVVISLVISILSLAVTSVNVYFTALRPARLAMTLTLVAETSRGGQRIIIPTSISNSGTQPQRSSTQSSSRARPNVNRSGVPNLRHPSLR